MEEAPLKISVIITNHKRKKYVNDSIISVVNSQSVEKSQVEVILVMDYSDDKIERFAREHGVKVFFTNEISLGKKLEVGILQSHGEILCFLDDDDMYHPSKLSYILKIMADPDVIFVHNEITQIGENEKYGSLEKDTDIKGDDVRFPIADLSKSQIGEIAGYRSDWYLSSMAIKANLARKYAELIGKCQKSLDKVIFLISVKECKSIVISKKPLTFYRKHISITGLKTDLKNFNISRLTFTRESIRTLETLQRISSENDTQFMEFIDLMRIKMEANAIIYGDVDIKRNEVIKKLRSAKVLFNCNECRQLIILLELGIFSKTIASFIYKKIQTRGI